MKIKQVLFLFTIFFVQPFCHQLLGQRKESLDEEEVKIQAHITKAQELIKLPQKEIKSWLIDGTDLKVKTRSQEQYQIITRGLVAVFLKAYNEKHPTEKKTIDEVFEKLNQINSNVRKRLKPEEKTSHFSKKLKEELFNIANSNKSDSLRYNKEYSNPIEALFNGKGQCFSLTMIHLLMERIRSGENQNPLLSQFAIGSDQEFNPIDTRPVVISTRGHILYGYIRNNGNNVPSLYGYETTAKGTAEVDFGPIKDLHSDYPPIVPTPIEYFAESLLSEKTDTYFKESFQDLKRHYGLNAEQFKENLAKAKNDNELYAKDMQPASSNLAIDYPWGYGTIEVPEGDLEIHESDSVSRISYLSYNNILDYTVGEENIFEKRKRERMKQIQSDLFFKPSEVNINKLTFGDLRTPLHNLFYEYYRYSDVNFSDQEERINFPQGTIDKVLNSLWSENIKQMLEIRDSDGMYPLDFLMENCDREILIAKDYPPEAVLNKIFNYYQKHNEKFLQKLINQNPHFLEMATNSYLCKAKDRIHKEIGACSGIKVDTNSHLDIISKIMKYGDSSQLFNYKMGYSFIEKLLENKDCHSYDWHLKERVLGIILNHENFNPCHRMTDTENSFISNFDQNCLNEKLKSKLFCRSNFVEIGLPKQKNEATQKLKKNISFNPEVIFEAGDLQQIERFLESNQSLLNKKFYNGYGESTLSLLLQNTSLNEQNLIDYFDHYPKLIKTANTSPSFRFRTPLSISCVQDRMNVARKILEEISNIPFDIDNPNITPNEIYLCLEKAIKMEDKGSSLHLVKLLKKYFNRISNQDFMYGFYSNIAKERSLIETDQLKTDDPSYKPLEKEYFPLMFNQLLAKFGDINSYSNFSPLLSIKDKKELLNYTSTDLSKLPIAVKVLQDLKKQNLIEKEKVNLLRLSVKSLAKVFIEEFSTFEKANTFAAYLKNKKVHDEESHTFLESPYKDFFESFGQLIKILKEEDKIDLSKEIFTILNPNPDTTNAYELFNQNSVNIGSIKGKELVNLLNQSFDLSIPQLSNTEYLVSGDIRNFSSQIQPESKTVCNQFINYIKNIIVSEKLKTYVFPNDYIKLIQICPHFTDNQIKEIFHLFKSTSYLNLEKNQLPVELQSQPTITSIILWDFCKKPIIEKLEEYIFLDEEKENICEYVSRYFRDLTRIKCINKPLVKKFFTFVKSNCSEDKIRYLCNKDLLLGDLQQNWEYCLNDYQNSIIDPYYNRLCSSYQNTASPAKKSKQE